MSSATPGVRGHAGRSSSLVLAFVLAVVAAYGLGWFVGSRRGAAQETVRPNQALATSADVTAATKSNETRAAVETAPISPNSGDARWQSAAKGPRTPAREREMAAALEELAATDPDRAMKLALAEPNFRLREILRNAALRGWASHAPEAALARAMTFPDTDIRSAIEAVINGAARETENALQLGRKLVAENPGLAADYGIIVITALSDRGDFAAAAKFAAESPAITRAAWLNTAFNQWALSQPEQALDACNQISDTSARSEALQGVIAGWAEANPAGLADYAMQMPEGEQRSMALGQALPRWVSRDPVEASKWLDHYDPDPSLDTGVMAIATMPALVKQRPEVSLEWAESIVEPSLRESTLKNLADQWARNDPSGFQRALAAQNRLRPEDRRALVEGAQLPEIAPTTP